VYISWLKIFFKPKERTLFPTNPNHFGQKAAILSIAGFYRNFSSYPFTEMLLLPTGFLVLK